MKSLIQLWQQVLEETGTWCSTSTTRDLQTATRRFEAEGISFLTITLANFGKDFTKALDTGFVAPTAFAGFRRRGGLPLFLGGFLELVFDRSNGVLLEQPDVDSIFALRQLTLMNAKILIPCSEERVTGAIDGYIKCENGVREHDKEASKEIREDFRRMSAQLYAQDVFTPLDSDIYRGDLVPSHGPGKTADRLSGNGKYDQRSWPVRLEQLFPYGDFAVASWRYSYLLDHANFIEPGAETPVKVVTVPKTLKTPRIIAQEPTAMQYMQQAVARRLVEYLEGSRVLSGMIGFSHQEPNQLLAKEGSLFGKLATLDLSEASDRVSNQHVLDLAEQFPHVSEALQVTRSTKADVPGHGVIPLSKFASMGSALCFPVEAMVFLVVAMLGIEDGLNRRLTRRDLAVLSSQVRVYGDDIIVPVEYVRHVVQRLESFGFRVNSDKSFWNGKFRESCGKDYYDGHDVTPIRVRREFPSRRDDAREIVSLVSLRNQLYGVGLWRTVGWLDEKIVALLRHFPIVEATSPVLGRHSFLPYEAEYEDAELFSPLVKGWIAHSKPPVSPVSGEGALLKCLLKQSEEPFADSEHLERQGRPEAVYIKLRKVSPF